jgi:hypothetical protein
MFHHLIQSFGLDLNTHFEIMNFINIKEKISLILKIKSISSSRSDDHSIKSLDSEKSVPDDSSGLIR